MSKSKGVSRRRVLSGAAAALGTTVFSGKVGSQEQTAPADPTKVQGRLASELGERSPHVDLKRIPYRETRTSSHTPLQDLEGIITPSDLHFERHHAGIPEIDPDSYSLLIHGMVDEPKIYTLEELRRFPAKSMIRFIECSGNGGRSYRPPEEVRHEMTPQHADGLTSTSEWTGVPLATLFEEVGVHPDATWFLAEAMDAAVMTRSIPVSKAWDDAMIAYAQNGEPLRPAQGYPARLLLPGFEGSSNVKWIRRIELSDRPFMTREETAKYTDPLPDGTARQFSFVMDAKSLITFPAYPVQLSPGWWTITGIAWTGRGKIVRVDISTDGGESWQEAELEEPVLPKCHTRFRLPWNWDGNEAVIMSRATDETGYTQPPIDELMEVRGSGTRYHYNHIRAWTVRADGSVFFGVDVPA